uniref:Uncharacterized protein n=1 Tax=Arundo donax TaxID=35708 RepID=A0A0A9EKF0_ARUDO
MLVGWFKSYKHSPVS